jgi:hypothetical protein
MAAPRKNTPAPAVEVDDVETLLNDDAPVSLPPARTEPEATDEALFVAPGEILPETVAETAGQKRIRELREKLEAEEIKDLEDKLATKLGAKAGSEPIKYADAPTGETLLLHFVEDGFIACGEVWQTGQELEFEIGGKAYNQQFDRNGNSWLNLVDDEEAQWAKFGKLMFRRGPFRGKRWGDSGVKGEPLAEDLTLLKEEQRRARRPPLINS